MKFDYLLQFPLGLLLDPPASLEPSEQSHPLREIEECCRSPCEFLARCFADGPCNRGAVQYRPHVTETYLVAFSPGSRSRRRPPDPFSEYTYIGSVNVPSCKSTDT